MKKNSGYIVSVSLIVALGGFLMGFDASVISGVVEFIEPKFGLTKLQLGWAVSCLTLTATLGMMISGPLSDKYGRKKILMVAALLFLVSAITSALANEFWFFIIARMLGGFGVGAALIVAPMHIAEISPSKLRGKMVSFNQLNIVLGISAAFFSNYLILKLGNSGADWAKSLKLDEENWRWMLGIESLPAFLYFIFLFTIPESPRWLVINGSEEKAVEILTKATGKEAALADIEAIKESAKTGSKKEKVPLSELFKPAMKLVLLIGVVIAILQQITGINSVFFYAPMIFEQTGIGENASFTQAIYVGLINVVFTILAMRLIDKLGRKPLLLIGVTGIAISMFIISASFSAATYQLKNESIISLNEIIQNDKIFEIEGKEFDNDLDFKSAVTEILGKEVVQKHESEILKQAININAMYILLGILAFVASFAISLGPVMWVLFSELFPNRLRGLAISFAGFINSGVSFLVQLVFPWELSTIGNTGTFLIYGIFAAFGIVFILLKVPETKGKSLEELEKTLVKA
jgi:SP family arabinose:H+ symporter-like MFS transporter